MNAFTTGAERCDLESGPSVELVKFTDGVNATDGFIIGVVPSVWQYTKEDISKNRARRLKLFKNCQVTTDN